MKTVEERVSVLKALCNLDDAEVHLLKNACDGNLFTVLNSMVENVVGTFPLPLSIATNFIVNGKDRLVAMAIEEASVVAAASNAARMARTHGGFTVEPVQSMMIGQVQLINVPDVENALAGIARAERSIIDHANAQDPVLVKAGGGARRIEAFKIATDRGCMLDVHIIVDCLDAMGANAVNTMAEAIAPVLEEITGGETLLKIISNLAIHRIVRARAIFDKELLGGNDVITSILDAVEFARHDIFRATTHNKGIMNGVSAVILATGNDTRAVEAGAHAFAAWNRQYGPLTRFWRDDAGNLVGELEMPVAVGIIGGATKTHPVARLSLKLMEIQHASELSQIIGAVGLAQNLAALRALASEGIQKGHMRLHAGNIVRMAGIPEPYHARVIRELEKGGKIRIDVAREIYSRFTQSEGEK